MKKTLIIIIGTLAIIASLVIVVRLIDNRATENMIKEIEERTCEAIISDTYNQAENTIAGHILEQIKTNGQVQINSPDGILILVPLGE